VTTDTIPPGGVVGTTNDRYMSNNDEINNSNNIGSATNANASSPNIALVVGSTAGGLVLCIAIGACALIAVLKRRKSSVKTTASAPVASGASKVTPFYASSELLAAAGDSRVPAVSPSQASPGDTHDITLGHCAFDVRCVFDMRLATCRRIVGKCRTTSAA
jgi:hypothetical protein